MSSFIATPPQPASPEASTVAADGAFWPPIDVNALRNALRLGDGVVTHERLTAAIEGAILSTMDELSGWKARQIAAGAPELAQVAESETLNGDPATVALWNRAVRFAAAAEIADAYADLTATNEGVDRATEKRTTADDYRRLATSAVRSLSRRGVQDSAAPAPAGGCLVDLV